jgi:hypothetical protein
MKKECFPFRPLLTERLLLGTPLPEDVSRHLDRCPDCTREASETDDVVRTLRRADPIAGWTDERACETDAQPSSDLGDRIRRETAGSKTAARPAWTVRPKRRRRIALGAAAALVAAAAVVVPLVATPDPAPETSVVLTRQGQMVDHPWGTEVPVALSGLEAGETYRMMTVNAEGTRAPGGSLWAASDEPVSTRMMTAMSKDTITALIVEDGAGRVVTRVPVRPSP